MQILSMLFLAAALVGGVICLGHLCWADLRHRDEFHLRFSEIQCQPPPGMTRREFIEEVQYFAGLGDRLEVLDAELSRKLERAFRKHPWVESASIDWTGKPLVVRANLTFRRPVLAVPSEGKLLAVDGRGIRLPNSAPTDGLPVFDGAAPPPRGAPGYRWGDAAVERKAYALAVTPR